MKIKNLVLGMMTCATFAACSSNEYLDNSVDGSKNKGDAYVAVNIVSTSSPNSKALGDIEAGSNEENKVSSAIFFFFDAEGNGCAAPSKPTLDFTDGSGNPSTLSKAVLVLEKVTTIPSSIVAVMNPTGKIAAFDMNTSLSTLRSTVVEASAAGSFIMSNSAYADNNKALMDATPISAANICATADDAKANPVTIHVERVVAKVEATLNQAVMSDEKFLINGSETKIIVKLLGWKATALNPESNLIKEIDPSWSMSWWNDPANSRSYWGISKTPAADYTYFDYTSISKNSAAEYCLENTTPTTTKLIVAAQLQTEEGAPIDLMEWKGSKNTYENMKIVLANTLDVKKYYIKTGDRTYTSLTAEHIHFTPSGTERYTVIATLAASAPQIYTLSGEEATTVTKAEVNATLQSLGEIKYWNNGASYFYIDIAHNGTEGMGQYGIIRNHSYKLNVTAVAGLGTPVPNPSEKIIPEKTTTDESSYLAATVQVLNWKIVSQDVSLSDK